VTLFIHELLATISEKVFLGFVIDYFKISLLFSGKQKQTNRPGNLLFQNFFFFFFFFFFFLFENGIFRIIINKKALTKKKLKKGHV
jgi:hypothetical protein